MALARHWWELLAEWRLPHWRQQGVTFVARAEADTCIRRIDSERCQFFGFDALSLRADGRLRVHRRWSMEWRPEAAPAPEVLIATLRAHPAAVTHYEFVFGISESRAG